MKKLLDHFWRKRPEASTPTDTQPAAPQPPRTPPANKSARPIATMSVAPRTVRPAWQATTGPAPGKRLAPQTERTDPGDTVTVTLGDIWDRLPSDLLASNAPDRSTPLTFDLAGLSERIGRGDPAIPVAEIAHRIPQLFRPNAVIAPDRMIIFPWKAVHNLIVRSRDGSPSGITPAGVEALSLKVRARRLHRPSKAAPAAARPSPPASAGSPAPEEVRSPGTDPIIPQKLTLQAPAPFAGLPARLGNDHAPGANSAPASAPAPFMDQEHERQLAVMREERDLAHGELAALREEFVALNSQATADREALAALRHELAGLQAQLAASAQAAEALKAELGTATPGTDPTTTARTAELIAERDAARAQAAKAIADGEAAMSLAAEQSAEREATLLRLKELAAERDAERASAAELHSERERERSHAAAIGGEMAAAVSHAAECDQERHAANARAATLAVERDAALARVAALEAAASQAPASAPAPATPEIESCRNTIQALYAERDALRQEQQQLTARLVVAGGIVDKPAVDAAAANRPQPDTYGGLFPQRTSTSPLVIILLMVLLAYGVFNVSKLDISQAAGGFAAPEPTESALVPAPVVETPSAPALSAKNSAATSTLEEVIVTPPPAPEPAAPADATVTAPTRAVNESLASEPTNTGAETPSQPDPAPAETEDIPLD